jgi:glutathione S-transferase
MMLKLYARANSGSAAVEALLSELDVPVELIDVPRNADRSIPDWFKTINSRGEVPALVFPDGSMMTESAAIMIHLADLFPEKKLAPAVDHPARAQYLRWMVYLAAATYISDLRVYYPEKYSDDPQHHAGIKVKGIADLNRDYDVLAEGLGQGPYMLGAEFSALDIYAAMLISWSEDVPRLLRRHQNLARLYGLIGSRPKITPVWARNKMPAGL